MKQDSLTTGLLRDHTKEDEMSSCIECSLLNIIITHVEYLGCNYSTCLCPLFRLYWEPIPFVMHYEDDILPHFLPFFKWIVSPE